MDVNAFIKELPTLAQAPGGIQRLRELVLELAVRGKLTEQRPEDGTGETVLQHVWKERETLIQDGKLSKPKRLPNLEDADKPDIPANWSCARFGNVFSLEYGNNLPKEKRSNTGEYNVYGSNGVVGTHEEGMNTGRCIVVGRKGSAGALNLNLDEKCWVTDVAFFCPPPESLDLTFTFILFQTLGLSELGKGIKPGLNRNEANILTIPVPPLAEQKRIVEQVDRLMGLLDRLEAAGKDRAQTQGLLGRSALLELEQAGDAAQTAFAWNRVQAEAHWLFKSEDNLKRLRQSILQLAVQGKLVPQDPTDEPVELHDQGLLQKTYFGKHPKYRANPSEYQVSEADYSFPIPKGWSIGRAGLVSGLITSGSRDWAKYYSTTGAVFLRMGNLSRDSFQLRLNQIQRVSPPETGEGTRTKLQPWDMLISITGDTGNLGLIPEGFGEAYINQHTAMLRPISSRIDPVFLGFQLLSPFLKVQFLEPDRGIKNSFRLTDVGLLKLVIPPLAEQKRIVAKVNALLNLLDQAETALTQSTQTADLLTRSACTHILEAS